MKPWHSLSEELDRWADNGVTATLWWRDDDAARPHAALDRLLGLAAAPLALAVIPARIEGEAAEAILAHEQVTVIQHGYAHRNHAAEGEPKCEFGDGRDADTALDELTRGRQRLASLFGGRFTAILAPPWNRMGASLAARLAGAGLSGLSAYGPRAGARVARHLVQVNSHIDIIDWRGSRGFVGEDAALGLAVDHLRARRTGTVDAFEPTGLLSHHLDHDAPAWRFIEAFMEATGGHQAARWLDVAEAFAP